MEGNLSPANSLVVFLSEHILATRTGLTFTPGVSITEWADVGFRLRDLEKSIHWWIGDWLRYGENTWGEDVHAFIMEETGFELGTLQNDKWVAGRFPPSSRDEQLSFSHHRMVADVENIPLRSELLEQAKVNGWSAGELLEEKKRVITPGRDPKTIQLRCKVSEVLDIPDGGEVDITFRASKDSIAQIQWFVSQLGLEVDAVITRVEK